MDQIVAFCNERNLLTRFQSGFRASHSSVSALLKILDDISIEPDRNRISKSVRLDFSKAFNTVNFKLLSQKFKVSSFILISRYHNLQIYLRGSQDNFTSVIGEGW
jgi:hypothetical protein